jgi:sugar lactone lactonase YvrE
MAPDGRIFVTIGSERETYDPVQEILEQKPYGRLVEFDPRTGSKKIVIPNLYFANGVVVDPHGAFVLVSDQYRYRIARYWLAGPKAGTRDNFVENLPGFVHNLSWAPDGTLWATLFQGRVGLIDSVHPHPWIKGLLARLPASLLNPPLSRDEASVGKGSVLQLSPEGEILCALEDPSPQHLNTLSTAVQHGDGLYIGTITGDAILRYPLGR